MTLVLAAVGLGLAAGVVSGLLGVGGGLLFVPTLLALGLDQREAEATSLLAILPTVAVGAWRQHAYGNLAWRSAIWLGVFSVGGVAAGGLVAEALPEHALRRLFAILMLVVAAQLTAKALREA